jgi:hypothetical protein
MAFRSGDERMALRVMNFLLLAYLAEADSWRASPEKVPSSADLEDAITFGNKSFELLVSLYEAFQARVAEGRAEFDTDAETALLRQFRHWLRGSRRLLRAAQRLADPNHPVEGLEQLRAYCCDAQDILNPDRDSLADQAHRRRALEITPRSDELREMMPAGIKPAAWHDDE